MRQTKSCLALSIGDVVIEGEGIWIRGLEEPKKSPKTKISLRRRDCQL